MITAERKCGACTKNAQCRYTGARWLCRICWGRLTDFPWEVKS